MQNISAVRRQYRLAALMQTPGFDSIPAIESGSVIRELLNTYEKRVLLTPNEWRSDEYQAEPCAI